MRNLLLTRAQHFYPFTDFMRRHGIVVEPLLARHRLPVHMLEMPDLFVDQTRFWPLLREVARREGLPEIGAVIGTQFTVSDLGTTGGDMLRQPSLLQALNVFLERVREESMTFDFGLRKSGSCVWFVSRCRGGPKAYSPYVDHYDIEMMKRIVEAAAGPGWLPPEIRLRADRLPPGMTPEMLTPGQIHYNAGETGVAIPVELLANPMRGYRDGGPHVPTSLSQENGSAQLDLPKQLRWFIESNLAQNPNLHDLAAELCTSERTLQRQLTQAGTSYRRILGEARFDLARKFLNATDASITDVAFDLGFDSPASFSRAFQRWAGQSPREYRKTNGSNGTNAIWGRGTNAYRGVRPRHGERSGAGQPDVVRQKSASRIG